MLENIWLMAAAHGVSVHIMSVFGNEPVAGEVKKLLNIPARLNIALGCRLGYPEGDVHRPRVRRDIEDFVSYNKYENKE
jgi:nitroreductase